MFSKLSQMIISLIVGSISARYLGTSNYGVLAYSLSIVIFFTSFSTLGQNDTIIKNINDNPDEEGKVVGSVLVMRLVSSFFCIFATTLVAFILEPDNPLVILLTFLQSFSLLFNVFEVITYWFQSKLQSKYPSIIAFIGYLIMMLYKILLIVFGADVIWFALSATLDYVIIAALLLFSYKKKATQKLGFSKELSKTMLKTGAPFILSGLMVALYGQMDKIMLGQMMNEEAVGYYTAAVNICSMWPFILSAIIVSANPVIISLKDTDEKAYQKRMKQLYATIVYISIFVSICITIFADLIIYILYGQEFMPAAMALRIITWYTVFAYIGVAKTTWLICENKHSYIKILTFSGAIANLVLNLVLIPPIGIVGASIATLITQVITNFVVPLVIPALREDAKNIVDAFLFRDVVDKATIKAVLNKIRRR